MKKAVHPGVLGNAFLNDADSYIAAAKMLSANPQLVRPTYFVLGHALELTLKAYLIVKGIQENELKQISHNLLAAYQKALDLNFCIEDRRVTILISAMTDFHEKSVFRFRVMNGDGAMVIEKTLIRAEELLEVISVIRDYIFKHVLTARLEAASDGGKTDVEFWNMGGGSEKIPEK